jgi:arsenate reductase
MKRVVYGIPACGTVRKAQAWLAARGVAFEAVDMRATPPDRGRVARWVGAFGRAALVNTSGGSYRALKAERGPALDGWTVDAWIDAFTADPMLIKRPVVEVDGEPAIVGWNQTDDALAARLRC